MKRSEQIRRIAQDAIDDPHSTGAIWATAVIEWADYIADLESTVTRLEERNTAWRVRADIDKETIARLEGELEAVLAVAERYQLNAELLEGELAIATRNLENSPRVSEMVLNFEKHPELLSPEKLSYQFVAIEEERDHQRGHRAGKREGELAEVREAGINAAFAHTKCEGERDQLKAELVKVRTDYLQCIAKLRDSQKLIQEKVNLYSNMVRERDSLLIDNDSLREQLKEQKEAGRREGMEEALETVSNMMEGEDEYPYSLYMGVYGAIRSSTPNKQDSQDDTNNDVGD